MQPYTAPLAYKKMIQQLSPSKILTRSCDVSGAADMIQSGEGDNSALVIQVEALTEFAPRADTPDMTRCLILPPRPLLYTTQDIADLSTVRFNQNAPAVPIEDMPTQLVACPDFSAHQQLTALALPHDEQNRRCLRITDATADTMELVALAVARYYELAGCYPTVIVLSAFRYLTSAMTMQFYVPPRTTTRIAITYEESNDGYDIVVRGE